MKPQEITDKEQWEAGSDGAKRRGASAEFLQSWEWGEFQGSVGNKPIRLKVDSVMIQGFEYRIRSSMVYLYVPRVDIKKAVRLQVLEYARNHGYAFVRFEPVGRGSYADLVPAPARQPLRTLMLDLTQSEEGLLDAMHSKTRYNIRLAEKKGVVIEEMNDAELFWNLHRETIRRDAFAGHARVYYEYMLRCPLARQFVALYHDEPVASTIAVHFKNRFTYLHGASSDRHRNVMAPYALQWHMIRTARGEGVEEYDFWGIAPAAKTASGRKKTAGDAATNSFHGYSWPDDDTLSGVTRFKIGFGGRIRSYSGAYDMVARPWKYRTYKCGRAVYRAGKKIRAMVSPL